MANSIEIKPDGSWVFHGGDDGDSRLRDPEKNAVPNYRLWNPLTNRYEYHTLYKVYCRNCGKEEGFAARQAVYIVYFCDDCWAKNQDPNFVLMPPDEEYRWRQGLKPDEDVPETSLIIAPKFQL